MARTSDWVQEQSTQGQTSPPEAAAHCPQPVTPPPRSISCGNQDGDVESHRAAVSMSPSRSKLVYSIPTLLSMRHMQRAVPIMLRVKPEAIAENIIQYMGVASTRRLPSRSRGLSDISNVSRGSITSNNIECRSSIGSRFMAIPKLNRQPPPPIGIPPPLQRHDGFVRFLQQHASPPHHRVTAGGRIVPAGPTSPPPMFDFGSLNGLVRGRLANADTAQKESQSVLSALKQHSVQAQEISSMAPGNFVGYPSNPSDTFAGQSGFPASSMYGAPYDGAQYGYQRLMSSAMQTPAAMVPIAVFPDGSTLVSCNGMHYRTYWNGVSTIMEPLQYLQQPAEQQSFLGCQQTPSNVSQYGFPPQPTQALNALGPLKKSPNESRASSSRKPSESLLAPHTSAKEVAFKQELTNIDKHLALYHFDITPAERTELVAQRRHLVESLDRIRVSKEKENCKIPIIAPHTGLPITPPAKISTDQKAEGLGADTQHKSTGKALSPAALPFVPKSTHSGPCGLPGPRNCGARNIQHEDLNASKRHAYHEPNLNVKDMVNAAIARKAQNTNDLSGSTQVPSHRQGSSSGVLDPSDPAMRVVEYEDIEYASRYLYNWGLDKKTYCTTVAEFQEAISRVRDQARRYGCYGGSSKDPAYDAEQDIWWAICDRDPIPLPTKVPDHVTSPRPWDWENSAFNFRRKDAPLPPLTIDNARNSPRLSGWDQITTESMKDRMDVTRSYYALKGQLPNTPFRTWAYDDAGNKVEIGDPHSLDHGRFQPRVNYRKTSSNISQPAVIARPTVTKDEVTNLHPSPDTAKSRWPLNTNEVNSPHLAPRFKNGRKMNLTEGDAVPFSTRDVPQQVSAPDRSNADAKGAWITHAAAVKQDSMTNPKKSTEIAEPRQPSVQDCPERPAARLIGPNVKSSPSPVETSTSTLATLCSGSKSKVVPAVTETPVRKPMEVPISTSQKLDIDPSMNPMWGDRTDPPTTVDAYELSAETRSSWGPDEGCGSVPLSSDVIADLKAQGTEMVAKVNIPFGMHGHIPVGSSCDSSKPKSVDIPRLESDSHQFLRKMLKNPNYSSVQSSKSLLGTGFGIADRLNKLLRGGGGGATRGANKENASSTEKVRDANSKLASKDEDQSDSVSPFKSEPDATVSKAPSSLASSSYQAHGYLPQLDGAGRAHAASLHQHQGNEPLSQQVRVSLPSSTAYAGSQTASTPTAYQDPNEPSRNNSTAAYLTPVSFGYDGGSDAKPSISNDASKAPSQSHAEFDKKGATPADFEIQRESPHTESHHDEVEDYFQRIAEKDRQLIASAHQSSGTGTGTS